MTEANAPLETCATVIHDLDRAIDADSNRIRSLVSQIRDVEASMKTMKAKRAQWIAARDRLSMFRETFGDEVTDGR